MPAFRIRLSTQFFPKAEQPLFQSCRLDHHEGLPIHPRRSLIGTHQPVSMEQNISPVDLVVELVEAEIRFRLRLEIELHLKFPDIFGCYQTHRQSPLLDCLGSIPEVRVLPSPGITRLQRYYDPLRLPAWPPAHLAFEVATLSQTGPPTLPEIPFPRAVPTTSMNRTGASDGFFPVRAAFPVIQAGRRSPLHFRGLLRVHTCYGPQDCDRPATLVTRLQYAQFPIHTAHQLPDLPSIIWVEPSSTGISRHRGALNFPG